MNSKISLFIGFFAVMVAWNVGAAPVAGTTADPVYMAHKKGFVGCDGLITKAFAQFYKASDGRVQTNDFAETVASEITIDSTFGSPGDTVWISAHFSRVNGVCYSTTRANIAVEGNCGLLLAKDQNFKYEYDDGGAVWAANAGGVQEVLIQVGTFCSETFVTQTNDEKEEPHVAAH